ncbi:MAG TPA: SGNH/GDSL hydrolase family protein [Ktedonobacteraceae bacterium]|nr:SGNH/GDSL hydrolase family protein [Ktedonobacteraceae bacterium]
MTRYPTRNSSTGPFQSFASFLILLTLSLVVLSCAKATEGFSAQSVLAQGGTKIMPLGDSITFGERSSSGGGYRLPLWEEIAAAHLHVTFVGSRNSGPAALPDTANEGHPGWRIDQISTHVVAWLEKYQPQIILLQIGTNDIIQNYHVSTAPQRLLSLLTLITATLPAATVFVAEVTPLGTPRLNAEIIAYNSSIPELVSSLRAEGKHVRYVDMYDAVPRSDILDHIHPDDQGYSLMAAVWYKALQPLL